MVHNKTKIQYYFYLNIIKKGRWEEKRGRGTKKGEGGNNIKYYYILKMIKFTKKFLPFANFVHVL